MVRRFWQAAAVALGMLTGACVSTEGDGSFGAKASGPGGDADTTASLTAEPPAVTPTPSAERAEVTAPLDLRPAVADELDMGRLFRLGVEEEARDGFPHLRNKRVTLITTGTAIDRFGRTTVEVLSSSTRFSLTDVVLIVERETDSPGEAMEAALKDRRDLTLHRLTRANFRLPRKAWEQNDLIVYDAALTGPRYALESAVLGAALEEASLNRRSFLVLDRPPLMRATLVEGPPAEPQYVGSDSAFLPVPILPGLTAGELATLYNTRYGISADLKVVPMENWRRGDGNRWLLEKAPGELSEQGARNLEQLRSDSELRSAWPELAMTRALLREADWLTATVTREADTTPTLLLQPAKVAPDALYAKLTNGRLVGLEVRPPVAAPDGSSSGTIALVPIEGLQISPVQLSLELRVAAVPTMENYARDPQMALYANDGVFEALARGLTPRQIRSRWLPDPAWRRFLDDREKVLLYQP